MIECVFIGNGNLFSIAHNGLGLCVVALSKNLKLTTTLDRAITQNPCYVPLNCQICTIKNSMKKTLKEGKRNI